MLSYQDPCVVECSREELLRRLEWLRKKLHAALDAAGGDHGDPAVLDLSLAFDAAMNDLMRREAAERNGRL